ncbi:hypothetical protein [Mesorhizobium sp. Mes31]|jgi:hypothetical protein|uniref:hypothetical protein n=1 Tax=Mesorhizobium sp. Mes31 TaxID=2926017 RepID=UPI0021187B19|nr:hypothetical protein [Mesorhizobium sp. Mes31]
MGQIASITPLNGLLLSAWSGSFLLGSLPGKADQHGDDADTDQQRKEQGLSRPTPSSPHSALDRQAGWTEVTLPSVSTMQLVGFPATLSSTW